MTTPELIIADALISHQLDLLRLGAYTQQQALSLLDELGHQLEQLLMAPGLTQFRKERIQSLVNQAAELIDDYYGQVTLDVHAALEGMAKVQAVQASRAVTAPFLITLQPSIPPTTFLKKLLSRSLIQGARSADWWRKQSSDTQFKFSTQVRQGVVQGETNAQIVARIIGTPQRPGVMTVSRKNARALIHASIQQVANDARLETFKEMSDVVKGVRQLSTLDSHTTSICIAYAGKTWNLQGKPTGGHRLPFNGGPPRHWGCRSVLVPITKSFRELGLADVPEPPYVAPRFASASGPTDMTMKQWLDTRTKEQLDDQLGKGRALLYRSGKITINELLDLRGRPLSLKQLERRANV